jgi:hypothetical protein
MTTNAGVVQLAEQGTNQSQDGGSTPTLPLHNSWNRKIVIEGIAALVAHPLSVKVYGEPTANEELLASVEKLGVLTPVTIDHANRILSGTSRHYAASVMHQKFPDRGFNQIPTVLFTGTELEGDPRVAPTPRRVPVVSNPTTTSTKTCRTTSATAKFFNVVGTTTSVKTWPNRSPNRWLKLVGRLLMSCAGRRTWPSLSKPIVAECV